MSDIENYLRDVVSDVIDRARTSRADLKAAEAAADDARIQYQQGVACAYYEIASLMVDQLAAFGIPKRTVGLPDDWDTDREFL